jgi:hypothetical protein
MEGPAANSSYYGMLAHEYGFSGSNLLSLLDICGFDGIKFHSTPAQNPTLKQRVGKLVRQPFLLGNRVRHRLFGVNYSEQFGSKLVVTGVRNSWPPFFDPKYR